MDFERIFHTLARTDEDDALDSDVVFRKSLICTLCTCDMKEKMSQIREPLVMFTTNSNTNGISEGKRSHDNDYVDVPLYHTLYIKFCSYC